MKVDQAKLSPTFRWRQIEPYWLWIVPLWLLLIGLYINHLVTGYTPDRAAIHIAALDFDIFWYAICIVGGIALGAYVVARLAQERALEMFEQRVPEVVRERPLTSLDLPEEINSILGKQKINNLGDLLLRWGYNPRHLGLNHEGMTVVHEALSAADDVKENWLSDAPWRLWNPEHVWAGIGWVLVFGIIGARLYHVLTPSPSMAALGIETPLDYFRNPNQLINLRNGGLGIYGGIAGGLVGLFIYSRRQRMPMLPWTDLCAIGIALGQGFWSLGKLF